jgi:P27 family predicted phage terminase small subunit
VHSREFPIPPRGTADVCKKDAEKLKRGRKPTPSYLKLIKGNPGKRPLNRVEPKPILLADLEPPPWLDREGREHWRYYAPRLQRLRILSELDRDLLAAASERWSVYIRSTRALRKSLVQITDSNGRVSRPEVAISKMAFDSWRAAMQEFGIGAASRSRVNTVPESAEEHPEDKYFTG